MALGMKARAQEANDLGVGIPEAVHANHTAKTHANEREGPRVTGAGAAKREVWAVARGQDAGRR